MKAENFAKTSIKPEQKLSAEAKKFLTTRKNNGGGGHCQGGGSW
ncbi:hypothetical protein [Pseudomonas abietaniphila]|uniref:Uncharacterized protein n=1 Tax=Pseudomonas abietaniphila TaxID=89065 RepID=A0A1G7YXC5_9PSED|nr:hypothetical protein [Pseudomonas abietaniphila]SDH01111.1 hypothetical protein SAMN05216605_104100 [Pseudomonas abietaniphila]